MIAAITLAAGLGALAPSPQRVTPNLRHTNNAHAASTATNTPINQPHELAIDAQGNLYVADTGSNAILVYNSSLVQQTGRTITNGLSAPWGVAVDPYGNIFASSVGTPGLTEYNPTGEVIPPRLGGFNLAGTFPTEIAVDPLDDLYVICQSSLTLNAASSLRIFEKHGQLDFTGMNRPQSVAVDGSDFVVAGVYQLKSYFEGFYADSLINGGEPVSLPEYYVPSANAGAIVNGTAVAAPGNLWFSDMSDKQIINAVTFGSAPLTGTYTGGIFKQLGYVPTGIAVDPARDRIYVSDFSDNQIQVLNMQTAALEAVIK